MGWTRQNVGVTVLMVMDEHRKQAGQRLAQLRDAKGWSQEDLARKTTLSVKTISRFENGRHDGRRDTVRRIVDALEIDEADLIGPPPDPLGLNQPTQLDRIEAKLDDLLARLPATPSDEVVAEVEAAGQQRDQQQTSPARASSRKKGSGRAA